MIAGTRTKPRASRRTREASRRIESKRRAIDSSSVSYARPGVKGLGACALTLRGSDLHAIVFRMAHKAVMPVNGLLFCNRCKQRKPVEVFSSDATRKCGRASRCKECDRERATPRTREQKDRHAAYKRDPANLPHVRAVFHAWRHTNRGRLAIMVHHAKKRAAERGLPFDITFEDLSIPERCPLLDIPITFGKGKTHAGSPSLDRIDPSLGYVRGNVWVISYRANAIKHDANADELELIAIRLRDRQTSQLPVLRCSDIENPDRGGSGRPAR